MAYGHSLCRQYTKRTERAQFIVHAWSPVVGGRKDARADRGKC